MNSDIKLVSELIAYSFEKYGDQTAVTYFCDKTSLTTKNYKELNRDVKRLAYYLEMQGLASTPICLIGDCSYEWIVSFYAIIWMGAYPVLIEIARSVLSPAHNTAIFIKSPFLLYTKFSYNVIFENLLFFFSNWKLTFHKHFITICRLFQDISVI